MCLADMHSGSMMAALLLWALVLVTGAVPSSASEAVTAWIDGAIKTSPSQAALLPAAGVGGQQASVSGKVIWLYWASGWDKAPFLPREVRNSWTNLNPGEAHAHDASVGGMQGSYLGGTPGFSNPVAWLHRPSPWLLTWMLTVSCARGEMPPRRLDPGQPTYRAGCRPADPCPGLGCAGPATSAAALAPETKKAPNLHPGVN